MLTLIKIAWKNVWRNKLRSSLVILSIVLGIWAGIFLMSMTLGLNEQRLSGAVDTYLSHVQVHHPDFSQEYNIKYTIEDKERLIKKIKEEPNVKSYVQRIVVTSMISNAKGSKGVQVQGIDPDKETRLTGIHQRLTKGKYFVDAKRNPILVGEKLANKLHLKIRSKVVLSLQTKTGDLTTASFRVVGIYKTSNSAFDEANVFVRRKELDKILELNGEIHEIAILAPNLDDSDIIKNNLSSSTDMQVETWAEISPELGYAQEVMGSMIYIFMGIVLIALAFSIINTMLMAVLERKRELGMLMAVGMNKKRLFAMISIETIFIALVATPIGMLLSYWSISYFEKYGIDLSAAAEGLESLGIGAIVYTYLPYHLYFTITAMTLLVAFVSSIFPARRALRLKPAEAIRSL